ncbi:MAG: hypothetical protein KAI73_05115 [Rhodospirillaceae bacterium]|nr:hypothetical protein [Rhodospirillaceae bacterium]
MYEVKTNDGELIGHYRADSEPDAKQEAMADDPELDYLDLTAEKIGA